MTIPRFVAALALVAALVPVRSAHPVTSMATTVPVMRLIRHSAADVDRALGKPSSTHVEKGRHGALRVRDYRGGAISVTFINGKADDITIHPVGVAFNARAVLTSLGLPYAAPTAANANTIRWMRLPHLKEVDAFPKPGGIDYIEVLGDHGLDY